MKHCFNSWSSMVSWIQSNPFSYVTYENGYYVAYERR